MKTLTAIITLIMIMSSMSGCLSLTDKTEENNDDDLTPLRINHIQVKGTHNSYHLEPLGPTIRAYEY